MDGHFVNNITIGIPVVEAIKKIAKIPLDVHLMISNPEKYIVEFAKAGSDIITIHVESTRSPREVLKKIRSLGKKAGITLKPETEIDVILDCLSEVDLVLVMTVEPGFGGQSFMKDQVAKIDQLSKIKKSKKYKFLIEVDGGVNENTKQFLSNADVLVAGSYVFKKPSDLTTYAQQIKTLRG